MSDTPVTRDPMLALIALLYALFVLSASLLGPYGYFIDEYYYLACARHPALGYVDHPPLAPLLLTAIVAVLGKSIFALRIVPALAAGATVFVGGLLARELGGGRFASRLAALAVAAFPVLCVVGSFYSMNAFEILIWSSALLFLVRLVRGGDPRLWLAVGALIGIGFELKHTIVVLVAGIGIGLVATPARRVLRGRWPWLGAAVALAFALPNLIWQITHDFASLDFYRQATAKKNVPLSPLGVLGQQLLVLHPLLAPIWGAGAIGLLAAKRFRDDRWIGVAWWTLLGILMVSGASRPDRITGLAPALFAAGSVLVESWIRRPIARIAAGAYALFAGLTLAPLNLPLFSFEATARYAAFTGAAPKIERGKSSPLPQWLADRTGWESLIDEVRRIHATLSPEERKSVRFYSSDYGNAGAIEHFIPEISVISSHNSYWNWSVGHTDSDVLIAIDIDEKLLRELFADVSQAGTVRCNYCMSWRANRPIWLAKKNLVPLGTRFAALRELE